MKTSADFEMSRNSPRKICRLPESLSVGGNPIHKWWLVDSNQFEPENSPELFRSLPDANVEFSRISPEIRDEKGEPATARPPEKIEEEFDEVLPAAAEDVGDQPAEPDTTGIETPQVAEPAAAPAVEPLEEAFEELADEFSEAEIPLDEFEDLDEDLEEELPADPEQFDVAPDDDFQDLDEEFDEFEDDEFEELEEEFDDSLVLALTISATISQYRGAVGIATNGRVVWTGDIVLPRFAQGY